MMVFVKKIYSIKWFIISVMIKFKKGILIVFLKFYCLVFKFVGFVFEFFFLKFSYCYDFVILCMEYEWSCWNVKVVLFLNYKGFYNNSD